MSKFHTYQAVEQLEGSQTLDITEFLCLCRSYFDSDNIYFEINIIVNFSASMEF